MVAPSFAAFFGPGRAALVKQGAVNPKLIARAKPRNVTPPSLLVGLQYCGYRAGSWTGSHFIDHEWLLDGQPTGNHETRFYMLNNEGQTLALRETARNPVTSAFVDTPGHVIVVPAEYIKPKCLALPTIKFGRSKLAVYTNGQWQYAAAVDHEWYVDGQPTGNHDAVFPCAPYPTSSVFVRETGTNMMGSTHADSNTLVVP